MAELPSRALPWRAGIAPDGRDPLEVVRRPVAEAARLLLGARLISTVGGKRTGGVIVETEAYGGGDDPASHAATLRGRTRRNRAMFGPPGRAYVYHIYGMHWCVNVVTGLEGEAQAVLIRGLDPLEGEEVMMRRRGGRHPLTAGPARLCQALAIDDGLYGHDLARPPLRLLPGWDVSHVQVGVSGRIGIREAADRPLRFYVRGAPGVSRRPHASAMKGKRG
ncbi:MAG: DNA-3-methyladenine glycosylase [Gemmatimonadota bacterium]